MTATTQRAAWKTFHAADLVPYLYLLPPIESLAHYTPYGRITNEGDLAHHLADIFQVIRVPLSVMHLTQYHHRRWVRHRSGERELMRAKITAREIARIYRQLRKRKIDWLLLEILHAIGWHPDHVPLPKTEPCGSEDLFAPQNVSS